MNKCSLLTSLIGPALETGSGVETSSDPRSEVLSILSAAVVSEGRRGGGVGRVEVKCGTHLCAKTHLLAWV